MALNDQATLVIGSGNYFTADVGTALPADLSAIDEGTWTNMGHTSLEDIFSIESEGGEATVLGTLQNKQLRTVRTGRTDTFTIVLQQFDTDALKFYHGSNAPDVTGGLIGNPVNPTATQRAYLAVFVDGLNIFAVYCPKAEIFRGDTLEFADTENLAGLPLAITPLVYGTNSWNYAVTPIGDFSGVALWVASTVYALGDEVKLTTGEILECTVAGTSDATEPEAPASVGGTVTDGSVTWQRVA